MATAAGGSRLAHIDALRGLVMVVMALDHVRFFATEVPFDPVDLTQTWPALFATRWVTHLSAPVFVLLAGTAAFLYLQSRGHMATARFLATRGLWLIVLELTVISFAFTFTVGVFIFQVIWAIGVSMLVLAGLVALKLPSRVILAFGVGMVLLHNLLDPFDAAGLAALGPVWALLHVQTFYFPPGGGFVFVGYPLIPWIGVMAAGYGFGEVFLRPADEQRRLVTRLGAGMLLAFLLLRAPNLYGDPAPWALSGTGDLAFSALSFLNVTKYPPSLSFLLVTLGISLLMLPALERMRGEVGRVLVLFGRVPLFYYITHLYAAHLLMIPLALAAGVGLGVLGALPGFRPPAYGVGLVGVYALWVAVVLLLVPLCGWFGELKRRRRDLWWLRYL